MLAARQCQQRQRMWWQRELWQWRVMAAASWRNTEAAADSPAPSTNAPTHAPSEAQKPMYALERRNTPPQLQ